MNKQLLEARGKVVSSEGGGAQPLKMRIRIIEGNIQGSSGYYPEAVLKEDGPKVFKKGTHMHLDHMGFWEMLEGSPGKLETLAGFLDSDAVYETVDGVSGLYSDAIVISKHSQFIKEVASNIGVSILAAASTEEGISPATGEPTDIVTGIVGVLSVDFVTHPGANGRIISSMAESAKNYWTPGYETGVKFISSHPAIESAGETKKGTKPMAELTEETAKALTEALTAQTAALVAAEAARVASDGKDDGDEQFDVAEAVLTLTDLLTESDLPATARARVIKAIKAGDKAEDAIAAEKAYIDSLTASVKKTSESGTRQFGELFVVEHGKPAAGENDWAKSYGRKAI